MPWTAAASAEVIVPNWACPSGLGGPTSGTTRSWIIHPSYQPDSLLMTNNPEMSVKMSMHAPGSLGPVGGPGLGSRAGGSGGARGAGRGDRGQAAGGAVGARRDRADIDVRESRGEYVRLKSRRVEEVVAEELAWRRCFRENRQRKITVGSHREIDDPLLERSRQVFDVAAVLDVVFVV